MNDSSDANNTQAAPATGLDPVIQVMRSVFQYISRTADQDSPLGYLKLLAFLAKLGSSCVSLREYARLFQSPRVRLDRPEDIPSAGGAPLQVEVTDLSLIPPGGSAAQNVIENAWWLWVRGLPEGGCPAIGIPRFIGKERRRAYLGLSNVGIALDMGAGEIFLRYVLSSSFMVELDNVRYTGSPFEDIKMHLYPIHREGAPLEILVVRADNTQILAALAKMCHDLRSLKELHLLCDPRLGPACAELLWEVVRLTVFNGAALERAALTYAPGMLTRMNSGHDCPFLVRELVLYVHPQHAATFREEAAAVEDSKCMLPRSVIARFVQGNGYNEEPVRRGAYDPRGMVSNAARMYLVYCNRMLPLLEDEDRTLVLRLGGGLEDQIRSIMGARCSAKSLNLVLEEGADPEVMDRGANLAASIHGMSIQEVSLDGFSFRVALTMKFKCDRLARIEARARPAEHEEARVWLAGLNKRSRGRACTAVVSFLGPGGAVERVVTKQYTMPIARG